MARIALSLAPLALLLTNACTVTIHGEAPASPEDVAWTPPPRVIVAEPAPVRVIAPAARDDGRRVVVERIPAPGPVPQTTASGSVDRTGTRVDSALVDERLRALRAARQEAADRRALAQSDARAAMVERERNRHAEQLEQLGSRPAR